MSAYLISAPAAPITHRRVLGLAVPMALANLTQPLLAAVDTAMAGHLPQVAALGGVALGGVFFNFVFWGFGFLRMGTTGLVAQAVGAGNLAAVRDSVVRALLLAFGIGLLVLLLQRPLLELALHLLGGGPAVQDAARRYAHARIWSAPLALGNYVVLGYLIGVQRVRLALLLQLVINLINMAAVFVLVRVVGAGEAGIGAATALADGCGFALAVLWCVGRVRGLPPLRWAVILHGPALRQLAVLNRDLFLRTLMVLTAFGWFAHAGARMGEVTLAANALLMNFQTFMAYGLDGLAHAVEALTGEAVGAGDRARLRRAIKLSLLWSFMLALVFSLVYAVAGPVIISVLTDQAGVRAATLQFLPWAVVAPVISVWGFMLDGVFIGATQTRALMVCMAVSLLCLAVGMVLLPPVWGNHGVWAAFMIFMAVRGATLGAVLLRRGLG